MEKPELSNLVVVFTQEGNCMDGGYEELEIRCESSGGVEHDKGCFFILKTEQWAVDSVEDLKILFDKLENAIKSITCETADKK